MINIEGNSYDLVAPGYCWGLVPKAGATGLLILKSKYDGKWRFNDFPELDVHPDTLFDFQTWNNGKLEWFHGVVDMTGKITQIG